MNKNLFCAHGGIKERKGSKKEHNKEREREKTKSKQELNSSVTSCDKARRGGKIH
jgi:hypothetical protein